MTAPKSPLAGENRKAPPAPPEPTPPRPLKVGDTVVLRGMAHSPGPLMTVTDVGDEVTVVWMDGLHHVQCAEFPAAALMQCEVMDHDEGYWDIDDGEDEFTDEELLLGFMEGLNVSGRLAEQWAVGKMAAFVAQWLEADRAECAVLGEELPVRS